MHRWLLGAAAAKHANPPLGMMRPAKPAKLSIQGNPDERGKKADCDNV
jgi:hypothetical protein